MFTPRRNATSFARLPFGSLFRPGSRKPRVRKYGGGGFAAEVSLLEPRVLLAGTGADCDDEGVGSTDSCTEFAAATQFLDAWGTANAAYGKAETAADVGLLRKSLNADFAYIDAVEAANESYWDDVQFIDAAYYDALDAADEELWDAESAAYDRLDADFADADAAYDDAVAAADEDLWRAESDAWDVYSDAEAAAAVVRRDAEREAYARFDDAVAAAFVQHQLDYEQAGEDWDAAEQVAFDERAVKLADAAFAWYGDSLDAEGRHLEATLDAEVDWWGDILDALPNTPVGGMGDPTAPQDGPVNLTPLLQQKQAVVTQAANEKAAELAAFKVHLKTLLDQSKLGTKSRLEAKGARLYLKDGANGGGFDCEDFALAYINYLRNQQAAGGGIAWDGMYAYQIEADDLSFVTANNYLNSSGTVSGHAGVLVQFGGKYFVVDPQTGTVTDAQDSVADAQAAFWALMQVEYNSTKQPLTLDQPVRFRVVPYQAYSLGQQKNWGSPFTDGQNGCMPHFEKYMKMRGISEADLPLFRPPADE